MTIEAWMDSAMKDDLEVHMEEANARYKAKFHEECIKFRRMLGDAALDRIKLETIAAIRYGNFEAQKDDTYFAKVPIKALSVSNVKEHIDEHHYFQEKYKDTHGIPMHIVFAEIANAIEKELSGIQVENVKTQHMSQIYYDCRQDFNNNCMDKLCFGFFISVVSILLCGIPCIHLCSKYPAEIDMELHVFFRKA
jgi:hypothetical protein